MRTARWATAGVVTLCGVVVLAPRVGERDRTEANVIGALRAIVTGELAYESANGGYYETLSCLSSQSCIPGRVGGPYVFLDPALAASREWRGYRLEFHAGPPPENQSARPRSASAMTRFALAAVPVDTADARRRAYCADDRQTIYFTPAGTVPRVESGRCLDTNNPVR